MKAKLPGAGMISTHMYASTCTDYRPCKPWENGWKKTRAERLEEIHLLSGVLCCTPPARHSYGKSFFCCKNRIIERGMPKRVRTFSHAFFILSSRGEHINLATAKSFEAPTSGCAPSDGRTENQLMKQFLIESILSKLIRGKHISLGCGSMPLFSNLSGEESDQYLGQPILLLLGGLFFGRLGAGGAYPAMVFRVSTCKRFERKS